MSMVEVMCSFRQINGLGYILGDFFTNSSGHPDWKSLSGGGGGALIKMNCFCLFSLFD
jgi:hypothetical protein